MKTGASADRLEHTAVGSRSREPLFAMLLGAAVAFGTSHALARKHAREQYLTQLDPLQVAIYPTGTAAAAIPRRGAYRVVLLGDSRARGWPVPNRLVGAEFINRGIDSQASAAIWARYYLHVAPLRADVVVIQAGINDIARIPLVHDRHAEIVEQCAANLAGLADRAARDGARVILTTVFPTSSEVDDALWGWSAAADSAVTELNRRLRSLQLSNVVVFDTGPILQGADGHIRPEYADGHVHVTPAGYRALNERLSGLVDSLARARRTAGLLSRASRRVDE
jgi:lysophospholipase L1-like esterase